jgi:c(7)-type cytochrome triheme protein
MKGGETMKKLLVIALVAVVSFVLAASAFAVGPGKTVEFEKGGKVVFSGDTHAKAGLKCDACHPAVFKMKKGGDVITMADINAGKFCGTCHKEGGKAFPKDAKCHKK